MIRPNQDDFPDLSDAGGFGAGSAIEVSSEDDPVLEARGNMGGSEDMEEVVPRRTEGLECGGGCAVPSSAGFSAGPLSGKISGAMGRLIGNSVSNPAPWSDLRRFSLSRDSDFVLERFGKEVEVSVPGNNLFAEIRVYHMYGVAG